jgi:hypothetical protein
MAVATVLRALAETTGVDVTALLAPVPRVEVAASEAAASAGAGVHAGGRP